MNRRQFLGRFFQAVITSCTSKSSYGIYHSWRQYALATTTLRISLKYKSGSYTYSLPSPSYAQTIIAVYDNKGTMIYCTAYYNGTTLKNNCRSELYLNNMPPGTYTIKCLCYGIGVCEGENGNEMTVTIPEIDRSTVPYNNYGWISYSPTVYVDYIFGRAGLSFTTETELETLSTGYYLDDPGFGAQRVVSTAPSYEECKSVAEAAAQAAGFSYDYSYDQYITDITRSQAAPISDEYRFNVCDIYYIHPKIKIAFIDTSGTENNIATIDLKYYNHSGSAAYWNICNKNGLEYDPETYYKDTYGDDWNTQISGLINTDGSYESYTLLIDKGILGSYEDIISNVGIYPSGYNGVRRQAAAINYRIYDTTASLTHTTPKANINGTVYYGTSMALLNIKVRDIYDGWYFEKKNPGQAELYEMCQNGSTPNEHYEKNLPTVKRLKEEYYNTYWSPALDRYGVEPEKDGTPWIKTDILDDSVHSYQIPLSAFFGKLTANNSLYPVNLPPSSGDIGKPWAKAYPYNRSVTLYWGLDGYRQFCSQKHPYDQPTRGMRPMLEGYTADLSEYDPNNQCDNSSMWTNIDGKIVFLRQTTIPVDMDAIPDHQISH